MARMNVGTVLLYHRVAELSADPQLLAVPPARFDEQLAMLCRYGTPMRVDEMLEAARERRLPPRAFAVTFDDGYADNWDSAEPVLDRHGVPATIFVTTGYLDGDREFWWDELERILLGPLSHHDSWTVEQSADPTPRHREYREWSVKLRGVSATERCTTLKALADRYGAAPRARTTHRPVTWERVAQAAQVGLIDVGAHTVSHPVLAARPIAEQRNEIAGCRNHIREATGRDPAGFSYPFGSRRDYARETSEIVRDCGFDFACANVAGGLNSLTDPFHVPRVLMRNWDADTLAMRLREYGW
jgi:peptidoglycan/xylan/chitin deacetylase (PgdA/CDA1 family)